LPRGRCFIGLCFILAVVFSFAFLPATAAAGHSALFQPFGITGEVTAVRTPVSALFQLGSASYMVDSQKHIMDAVSYMKNNRVFVPVRYLAYACGVTEENIVYENGVIHLISDDKVIRMVINDRTIVVNGLSKFMDVAPELVRGRTYLPARYVAEALGYTVSWDASTQTVSIIRRVLSIGEVIEIAQPAVVLIQTHRSCGSGFFCSSSGAIITNAHVVAGARDITVTTSTGGKYPARIEKLDTYLDIAILRVDGDAFTFIPHCSLEVERGDEVVALSNPLGLRGSASKGTTYLESIRNSYAGNAKLLEVLQYLQFPGLWTATQARQVEMALSEAERYRNTANSLLDKYNRDKKDLFERLFSLR